MEAAANLSATPLLALSKTFRPSSHVSSRGPYHHLLLLRGRTGPYPFAVAQARCFRADLPRGTPREWGAAASFVSGVLRCGGPSSVPGMAGPGRLASISSSAAALAGSGGGGGADGSVGGGGGGDGGSNGGDVETKPAVGGAEDLASPGTDVIILDVGGMSCGGCAASVKRILESRPEVSSATVNLATETAVVWPKPEAKAAEDWKLKLGEQLATHLTTCGFKSSLRGQGPNVGGEGSIS